MNNCIGCGITLQNVNKDELGYTINLNNLYCERCFKTIHYNEERKVNNVDNLTIINKINKMNSMTIFITDLLSINNELINVFKSITNNKVFVINKCDIIPNNLVFDHIKENIKNSYDLTNEVLFISAKKDLFLNQIKNIILDNKKVIICGETSSGKSTLINRLINSNLTTSKYNNTTLDFIKLKYEDYTLIDSPGLIINKDKLYSEKVFLMTKYINQNYIYNFDNICLNGEGNLTIIYNELLNINSKKDNINLDIITKINPNSDIVLDNGFIYIKDALEIKSNRELEVRKSIIGR